MVSGVKTRFRISHLFFDAPHPQDRFAVPAFAFGSVFLLGGGLPDVPLLVGQSEDLSGFGDDGQAVVLQEAASATIADGAVPCKAV